MAEPDADLPAADTVIPRDVVARAVSSATGRAPSTADGTALADLVPTPHHEELTAPGEGEALERQQPDGGLFARLIGLIIFGLASIAAALLIAGGSMIDPATAAPTTSDAIFGIWEVFYAVQAPSPRVMLSAMWMAALLASGVALIELRISTGSRRSSNSATAPLAPKVIMARTRGVFAGPVTVTVLIPAHNEEASLAVTIASLLRQSHPPERIVVVADNCTDSTVEIARRSGVDVVESVGNTHKKAGALNQVLRWLLPAQGDNDTVMIMDADTSLDDGFLETAVARFTSDRALMALGGLFYGEDGAGVLGQFQRNEYIRYSRDIRRRRGRVFVLTGTASIFRPVALRTVAENRGSAIPGANGDVYDTAALTEDNELTIALKSLGALMTSPNECTVVTEMMPSWRALWNQRLRWQRGALENLGAYGLTPKTFRYWAQQLGIGYGVIALSAYFLLLGLALLAVDTWIWFPFWMGLGLLFTLERVVTVWHGGRAARLLAATLIPELVFATFLNVVYLKGVVDILRRRQAGWVHVARLPAADDVPADVLDERSAR